MEGKANYQSVTVECKSVHQTSHSVYRELKVSGKNTELTILHIHFKGWHDFEAPENDA